MSHLVTGPWPPFTEAKTKKIAQEFELPHFPKVPTISKGVLWSGEGQIPVTNPFEIDRLGAVAFLPDQKTTYKVAYEKDNVGSSYSLQPKRYPRLLGMQRWGDEEPIPELVILTGPNGSGKSQLLHYLSEALCSRSNEKVFYLEPEFVPSSDEDPVYDFPLFDEEEARYDNFIKFLKEKRNYEASRKSASSGIDFWSESATELYLHDRRLSVTENLLWFECSRDSSIDLSQQIQKIIRSKLAELKTENLHCYCSTLFHAFKKFALRQVARGQTREKLDEGAPWTKMNTFLLGCEFHHEIKVSDDPDEDGFYSWGFYPIPGRFQDQDQDLKVRFKDLSSGEQMIFRVMIWQFALAKENPVKIMLLDEPDKHLDPRSCKIFIQVISNQLVKAQQIQVIMTTHRLDTVALVKEGSTFTMEHSRETLASIQPCHKVLALSRLARNLNAFSAFHIKVFVEAFEDRHFYDTIYSKLMTFSEDLREKPVAWWRNQDPFLSELADMSRRYQIQFHSVCDSKGNSGGCTMVKKFVDHHRADADNPRMKSFGPVLNIFSLYAIDKPFGIIDEDENNPGSGSIFVAEGRYSLENFLCDPIFIASILKIEDFNGKDSPVVQKFKEIIMSVQNSVFGSDPQQEISSVLETQLGDYVTELQKAIDEYYDDNLLKISDGLLENKNCYTDNLSGNSIEEKLVSFGKMLSVRSPEPSAVRKFLLNAVADELKRQWKNRGGKLSFEVKVFPPTSKTLIFIAKAEQTPPYQDPQAPQRKTWAALQSLHDFRNSLNKHKKRNTSCDYILFPTGTQLSLQYPTWLLKTRGHDLDRLFTFCFGGHVQQIFLQKIAQAQCVAFPKPLLQTLVNVNTAIRNQVRVVIKKEKIKRPWSEKHLKFTPHQSSPSLPSSILQLVSTKSEMDAFECLKRFKEAFPLKYDPLNEELGGLLDEELMKRNLTFSTLFMAHENDEESLIQALREILPAEKRHYLRASMNNACSWIAASQIPAGEYEIFTAKPGSDDSRQVLLSIDLATYLTVFGKQCSLYTVSMSPLTVVLSPPSDKVQPFEDLKVSSFSPLLHAVPVLSMIFAAPLQLCASVTVLCEKSIQEQFLSLLKESVPFSALENVGWSLSLRETFSLLKRSDFKEDKPILSLPELFDPDFVSEEVCNTTHSLPSRHLLSLSCQSGRVSCGFYAEYGGSPHLVTVGHLTKGVATPLPLPCVHSANRTDPQFGTVILSKYGTFDYCLIEPNLAPFLSGSLHFTVWDPQYPLHGKFILFFGSEFDGPTRLGLVKELKSFPDGSLKYAVVLDDTITFTTEQGDCGGLYVFQDLTKVKQPAYVAVGIHTGAFRDQEMANSVGVPQHSPALLPVKVVLDDCKGHWLSPARSDFRPVESPFKSHSAVIDPDTGIRTNRFLYLGGYKKEINEKFSIPGKPPCPTQCQYCHVPHTYNGKFTVKEDPSTTNGLVYVCVCGARYASQDGQNTMWHWTKPPKPQNWLTKLLGS